MGRVVKLFDDRELLSSLAKETVSIIHLTDEIPAIKKLLEVHHILSLSLELLEAFPDQFSPFYWHLPAINDLERLNRELLTYHRAHFKPVSRFDEFSAQLAKLVRSARRHSERGIVELLG